MLHCLLTIFISIIECWLMAPFITPVLERLFTTKKDFVWRVLCYTPRHVLSYSPNQGLNVCPRAVAMQSVNKLEARTFLIKDFFLKDIIKSMTMLNKTLRNMYCYGVWKRDIHVSSCHLLVKTIRVSQVDR